MKRKFAVIGILLLGTTRMKRRAALFSVLLLLAGVAFAKPRMGREIPPEQRELMIRQAYMKLAEISTAAGEGVRFEIGNVRTIEAADFGQYLWLDLVTMPGGEMIDMAREARRQGAKGPEMVSYRPQWKTAAAEYLASPEGLRLLDMRVDQVLTEIARAQSDAGATEAMTSFEVTVGYQNRSRSYRAAVLWLPPKRGVDATVVFLDNITQGVENAVRERPNPEAAERPIKSLPPLSPTKTVCMETTTFVTPSGRSESSSANHVWGEHFSSAGAEFACHCYANCYSECVPTLTGRACDDNGFPSSFCHAMATNANYQNGSTGAGLTAGASCAAGHGCVEKACAFCACGLGVGISFGGGASIAVNFMASGFPDWAEGNFGFSHQCAACEPTPPPPPGWDPPVIETDYENPTGGTSGGSWCRLWHTTCTGGYRPDGTYYIECRPDYCLY
jgi:hypothetical protein